MTGDYYAILGVSPTSEDVVIRAAYRALMRRYHPDADPSGEASERARAINAAYAVLGDPEKRARYDGSLAAQGMIKPEAQRGRARHLAVPRPGPAAIAALALLAGLLALIFLSPPLAQMPRTSAGSRSPAVQTPAAAEQARKAAARAAAREGCRTVTAQRLVKNEIFARAAKLRGVDSAQLEPVARRALMRIELLEPEAAPDAEALGCGGWLALDLPPGVVVEGGRSNLNSEIGYSLVAGGSGGVRLASLSGADRLILTLATLSRAAEPELAPEAMPDPKTEPAPRTIAAAEPQPRRREAPPAQPSVAQASKANTVPVAKPREQASATCGMGTRVDRALCKSRNLTALDRHLAQFTSQSVKFADEKKKTALATSSQRFRKRRDRCQSESCLTKTYVEQMRTVSDIMAGRAVR